MVRRISKRNFLKNTCAGAFGAICLKGYAMAADDPDSGESISGVDLWTWSKESMFAVNTPRGIKCMICPNECILKPGDTSFCRNRINYRNKLYSIAYGNPCSKHVDPIEKKPFFHFYPGSRAFSIATAGCNFSCLNCQNWSISQTSPTKTRNYDMMPPEAVKQAVENSCTSIAYTYSEPITFYEYAYDTSIAAHQHGIKNVLVSNGYINEKPLRQLCKVIDAATIDLKSFDDNTYIRLNAGGLQPVLNALKIFLDEGVWLEISNLVIPEWSDSTEMIKKMCDWLVHNGFEDTPLHFLRFQPLYKLSQLPPTPVPVLQKSAEIAKLAGLNYVYIGNVPGTEATNTRCPHCKKNVIERKGHMVTSNHVKEGNCSYCGKKIAGRWV